MSAHDPPRRQYITAPLLRRESMGETYHVLTFDAPQAVDARPGHFLMLRGEEWGQAPLLPRPMSYLGGGPTPSVLIKVFGEGTQRMGRAEPGEPYALLGPLGQPWRAPQSDRRPVLVAGGVGVAPLLFLARELAAAGKEPLFLYGGRTERDLPLYDDISDLCALELATEDGSRGHHGYVTELLAGRLEPGVEVFTCGPDRMMARVAELCEAADIPCEASLETPMACGYGVCLGCAVPRRDGSYLYSCTEGPCVDARQVAWQTPEARAANDGRRA